ncbi:MAG: MBL fold metallo-hydrolase [Candidatus Azobacteroides sp.]|nr:MBL fold metallo-hydrolase [Candidatus Azobacteroides sp.]
MALKFLSLASGSSGNCYFLGANDYGILLDAGIHFRTLKKGLKDHRIALEQILGVFITHDHIDHIKSVGSLGEKQNIPIYATQLVHAGINSNRFIEKKLHTSCRIIEKEQAVAIRDFTITAFAVPHDASDCVGYSIQYQQQTCVLATDVGHIDATVAKYLRMANHLILETNYDKEMLLSGHYPPFLKTRIMNGTGHLCNTEAAEFLAANYDGRLKNIWLCHLSKDNNRPELACQSVEQAFIQRGIRMDDIRLAALQRTTPSELFVLD